MNSLPRNRITLRIGGRGSSLVGTLLRRRRAALVVLAPRLAILLAGLALLLIASGMPRLWSALLLIGLLVAVISPGRGGAGLAVGAAIAGWLGSSGAHSAPAVIPTVSFAAALYLLHTSAALAGVLPLTADASAAVLVRWLRRCVPQLAVAAVLIWLSYLLNQPDVPQALELAGLFGAVVLIGVPVALLNRSRD
jgi:hypothetical protein